MGYWESFREISDIAEVKGIRRAIDDYEDHPDLRGYCVCRGATRERDTGRLLAVIVGQGYRTDSIARDRVDWRIPFGKDYNDCFEDIDDAEVEAAAKERPCIVAQAYISTAASFERAVAREREERAWREEQRIRDTKEADEVLPAIKKYLLFCGTATSRDFQQVPLFKGVAIDRVLENLKSRGIVTSTWKACAYRWQLSEEVLDSVSEEELAEVPNDPKEKVIMRLREWGPSRLSTVSAGIGLGSGHVRTLLLELVEEGLVEVYEQSRSKYYRLPALQDAA